MDLEERKTVEYIVNGIVNDRRVWDVMLPGFLKELSKYNVEDRKKLVDEVTKIALERLSNEDYGILVERVATSMSKLPDEIRFTLLTSNMISPTGLSEEKKKKISNTLGTVMKRLNARSYRDLYEVIRTVLDAMLTMPDADAVSVMEAIIYNSLRFSNTDYITYATAWLGVIGEMDEDSIVRLLRLRKKAIARVAAANKKERDDSILLRVAMLVLPGEKRKKLIAALKKINS